MTNLQRGIDLTTVVLFAVLGVCAGQNVSVNVPSVSADNGTQVTMSCSYSITGSGYTVFNVQWAFGEDPDAIVSIAAFQFGSTTPTYYGDYANPAYIATRTDAMSDLVIAESRYEKDDGTYWCLVEYAKGTEEQRERESGKLDITVLPSRPTLSNGTHDFPEGSIVKLLAGDTVQFTCMVAYVKPQANFTWTYGSDELEGKPEHVLNGNGLYNSTSRVDLTAKFGQTSLQCTARNKPGHAGESASVTLDVEILTTVEPSTITTTKPATPTTKPVTGGITSDTTTTPTPQETTTPTSPLQGTTMSPSAGNTESSTNIATANSSIIESTSPTTTTMTTAPGTFTTNTPYSTTSGCATLCDEEPIGLSTPAKIGIGVGCACGCVIAAGCGIAIYKYNKTTEVTPEGQSKEGQSKKGQSKKGKKKDADGKTPENV